MLILVIFSFFIFGVSAQNVTKKYYSNVKYILQDGEPHFLGVSDSNDSLIVDMRYRPHPSFPKLEGFGNMIKIKNTDEYTVIKGKIFSLRHKLYIFEESFTKVYQKLSKSFLVRKGNDLILKKNNGEEITICSAKGFEWAAGGNEYFALLNRKENKLYTYNQRGVSLAIIDKMEKYALWSYNDYVFVLRNNKKQLSIIFNYYGKQIALGKTAFPNFSGFTSYLTTTDVNEYLFKDSKVVFPELNEMEGVSCEQAIVKMEDGLSGVVDTTLNFIVSPKYKMVGYIPIPNDFTRMYLEDFRKKNKFAGIAADGSVDVLTKDGKQIPIPIDLNYSSLNYTNTPYFAGDRVRLIDRRFFDCFSFLKNNALFVFTGKSHMHFFNKDFKYLGPVEKEETPIYTLLGQQENSFSVPIAALQMLHEHYTFSNEYFVVINSKNKRNICNSEGNIMLEEDLQFLEKISSNVFYSSDFSTQKKVMIEMVME